MQRSSLNSSKGGKNAALLFGSLISLLILVVLFYGLDWGDFFQELGRIKLIGLIPFVIVVISSFFIRALRWRWLLPKSARCDFNTLFDASVLGVVGNFVLPLRAGEIIRPLLLSRWLGEGVSFSAVFASIVIERVFDVLAILSIFGLCLLQLTEVPPVVILGAQALGLLAGVIALAMVLSYFVPNYLRKLTAGVMDALNRVVSFFLLKRFNSFVDKFQTIIAKLQGMIFEFIESMCAISSFREFVIVIFLSYLFWLSIAFMYYIALLSFGLNSSFWMALTLSAVLALAVAAPSAPGFVGTFQAGCVLALSVIYGYSREVALSYSLVTHILQVLIAICLGIYVVRRRGLSIRDVLATQGE